MKKFTALVSIFLGLKRNQKYQTIGAHLLILTCIGKCNDSHSSAPTQSGTSRTALFPKIYKFDHQFPPKAQAELLNLHPLDS